jgi:excinuclease ABC subunit B
VTTLTKRTAEDLSEYLRRAGLKVEYLHSDIDAIERVDILIRLRKAEFDCLVGINLLREGLDLPEVALVAILDADKEGFLRSQTALIQVAGRTARHVNGKVILYADTITNSIRGMMEITEKRRLLQLDYNKLHNITPRSIQKSIQDGLVIRKEGEELDRNVVRESGVGYDVYKAIDEIEREMLEASGALEFERAAALRDELMELKRGVGDEVRKSANAKKKPAKLYRISR